jgi:hypothetical protein
MILTYYHNTIEDIPRIRKGLARLIKQKYNAEVRVTQFEPQNKYILPYPMITEITLTERTKINGELEVILEDIKKAFIYPPKNQSP